MVKLLAFTTMDRHESSIAWKPLQHLNVHWLGLHFCCNLRQGTIMHVDSLSPQWKGFHMKARHWVVKKCLLFVNQLYPVRSTKQWQKSRSSHLSQAQEQRMQWQAGTPFCWYRIWKWYLSLAMIERVFNSPKAWKPTATTTTTDAAHACQWPLLDPLPLSCLSR